MIYKTSLIIILLFIFYTINIICLLYFINFRSKINNLRIGDLAIAGTHNAGAWKFNTEVSSVSRDSFVLCQDRSIWGQLVHGIRYFDFRIAYYEFYQDVENRFVNSLIINFLLLPILYLGVIFAQQLDSAD